MVTLLLVVVAFLLGSIPFGMVIAGIRGIDLKKVGSGNIGATNVLRSVGKIPALLTLAGDILKGTVAVALADSMVSDPLEVGIVGVSAIAGHTFSLFLRFRGGKGVATAIGVLLAYSPKVALVTVMIWLVTAGVTRYSSLGALISFTALPFTMYAIDPVGEKAAIAAIIAVLLILRHTANIQRLIQGRESKIGTKV